jgi:hypothetical protein
VYDAAVFDLEVNTYRSNLALRDALTLMHVAAEVTFAMCLIEFLSAVPESPADAPSIGRSGS